MLSVFFTLAFWIDAFERTVRTFAQAALGLLVAGPVLNLLQVDWVSLVGTAGLSALIALLGAIAAPAKSAPTEATTPEGYSPKRANGL